MKIAVAQMDMAFENISYNKAKVKQMVQDAAKDKAQLIVFPELTLWGFSMQASKGYDSLVDNYFKELSRIYGIKIIYGKISKKMDGYYNSLVIVDGNEELMHYDKIHPFLEESKYYQKGNLVKTCLIEDFQVGAFICFDLRFPEIFQLASRKAELIVVIASWPEVRDDHWLTLLKARAIENQCFILGVNRVGDDPNFHYVGHSVLFDPWGRMVNELSDEEKLFYVDLDKGLLENQNFKACRRDNLYLKLWEELKW